MVTLREVLNFPSLGLTLLVGDPYSNTEIRWAHVSEMEDPTPWLEGGELLLTTGLNASWSYERAAEYCERLSEFGVAALGVSTGADLIHASVPESLVRAAREYGLPLVDVPNLTPLQSVVRAVADAINAESTKPLKSTIEIQRQLTEAAASAAGLDGVIERLRMSAHLNCVVYDTRLKPLVDEHQGGWALSHELRQQICRRVLGESKGSMTLQGENATLAVLPLGAEGRIRGVLVAHHTENFSSHQRSVLRMASPILSLLLDLRHAAESGKRQAHQALIEALLSGSHSRDVLLRMAARAKVEVERVQVVRVRMRSGQHRRGFVAEIAELAGELLVRNEDDRITAVVCEPRSGFLELLKEVVEATGAREVGVGKVVPLEDAEFSFHEATRASEIARARGLPMVVLPDYKGGAVLDLIGNSEEQSAFAASVLQPIIMHDRANPRQPLLPALRAYFTAIGSLELAAADLGIHRHTMRSRLIKISEVSGYDLNRASEYLELWLAVEFHRLSAGRDRKGK